MIAAYYQFSPKTGKAVQNIASVLKAVDKNDFDLLVLPELCTTGYGLTQEESLQWSEPVPDGPTTKAFLDYSRSRQCTVVWGMAEREGCHVYNSAVLVHKGYYLGKYRKIHLFLNEKDIFTPGNLPFTVWEVEGVKIGLMICFDWAFPEAARTLGARGAQVIAHPSNLVLPLCQKAMPIRALENRIFTITANRCGRERGLSFTGKSLICAPDGSVLSRASKEPAFGYAVLDPSEALNKSLTPRNSVFEDRRPSFYL